MKRRDMLKGLLVLPVGLGFLAAGKPIPSGPGKPVPGGPGKPIPSGPGKPVPSGPGKPIPSGPGKPTPGASDEETAQRTLLYLQRGWISQEAALRYMGLDPMDPEVQAALRG